MVGAAHATGGDRDAYLSRAWRCGLDVDDL
jgi:hypothetical protein